MKKNDAVSEERNRLDEQPEQPEVSNSQSSSDVARRAYDLYRERGAADGHDLDDWLAAERQLRNR